MIDSKTWLDLPCDLTETELREKQDRLADRIAERTKQSDEVERLKEALKMPKGRINAIDVETSKLAGEIQERSEVRHIECVKHFDEEHSQVVFIRTDTGEVAKIRQLMEHEKQLLIGQRPKGLTMAIQTAILDYEDRRSKLHLVDEELEEHDDDDKAPEEDPESDDSGG